MVFHEFALGLPDELLRRPNPLDRKINFQKFPKSCCKLTLSNVITIEALKPGETMKDDAYKTRKTLIALALMAMMLSGDRICRRTPSEIIAIQPFWTNASNVNVVCPLAAQPRIARLLSGFGNDKNRGRRDFGAESEERYIHNRENLDNPKRKRLTASIR